MSNLSIGQIILELRKTKGSTQEELANAVGISAQAVSKWENGGTPDTELLPAIADYFNVPIDRLFGRTTHPNLSEAVNKYVGEPGFFKGVDRALSIYTALHAGLAVSGMDEPRITLVESHNMACHHWGEEGYSLLAHGYGNLVTRKFWESVNLETAVFARELFALLAEPAMLEVLFVLLRRKGNGPANLEMIKATLASADCSDQTIQECLDKLVERKIILSEDSPYDEIGKVYGFLPHLAPGNTYLGICAVICAAHVLKITAAHRQYSDLGAWPINLQ